MTDPEGMRRFWDDKAQDNALWYVHSGLEYHAVDVEEFWASGERDIDEAMEAAGVDGGSLAIDIGVGAARLTSALAKRFDAVRSFDVSPEMVAIAKENLEKAGITNVEVEAVSGDGRLPVPDGCADFVLSLQVFQHIPDRNASLTYMREAGRALKPGGKAIFQLRSVLRPDPVTGWAELGVRAVVERIRRLRARPAASIDSPAWRGKRIGRWQIESAAARGGMRIVRSRWISKRGASFIVVCEKI